MNIKLYNSLSRKIEDFQSIEKHVVGLYSCGPTVYNNAHIGNMRAFLFADLIQRVLKTVGNYRVKWVMNITNIDDKTIRDSQPGSNAWLSEMGEQSDDPKENLKKLTLYYEKIFIEDISKLGITFADFYSMPRATDHIETMQDLILKIIENGYAYTSDDSVYFDVNKWSKDDKYGKLFHIDFSNFRRGERVDTDEYDRESFSDFVLWKGKKINEPVWDFVIDGKNYPGRPGWHIECSAMEKEILGLPFDIHTGGIDLKFPHHEDEIAQSKAGYGVEPTNYWCHNEFLEVEGTKMSKSAGNFFTIQDLLDKGIDPIDIRYAMLSAHYRTKYNFTFNGLEAAKKARFRIQEYIYDLFDEIHGENCVDIDGLKNDIFSELANDLHTPKALAKLFTFINNNNVETLDRKAKSKILGFLMELNGIFAVWKFNPRPIVDIVIPDSVRLLAENRYKAKQEKNWAEADKLRDEIASLGFIIKDNKDGYDIVKN